LATENGFVSAAILVTDSEKFADVDSVAEVSAIDKRKDVLYVPFQWQPIMFIIRNIPERLFKKLNL
jgi:hypothetical protein